MCLSQTYEYDPSWIWSKIQLKLLALSVMLIQFLFSLVIIPKRNSVLFPGKMSGTLEDKEDISGNPLLLVSKVRPMELGIVWWPKKKKNETDPISNWKVRLASNLGKWMIFPGRNA